MRYFLPVPALALVPLYVFFPLLSLSLSHVTYTTVLYIASSSFLFLFLNNTILMCPAVFAFAMEIEVMARRRKHKSIFYGQLHSNVSSISRKSAIPLREKDWYLLLYIPTF